MNAIKRKLIQQIKEEYFSGNITMEDYENLINGVDYFTDQVVDFIIRNGNVDLYTNAGYDIKEGANCFTINILNNPISQEELGDITINLRTLDNLLEEVLELRGYKRNV